MEPLNVDAFIAEIHQRPALWDVRCSDYSHKEKKKKAWEEIVTLFIGDEKVSVADKREFGRKLQRRWKSLRDSYAREVRIQKKSGSGSRKRPIYVYFKQLSFLETIIATQPIPNSSADESQPVLSLPLQRSTSPISKRNTIDIPRERLVIAVEKSVQAREERDKETEDSDRLFLLSLLNPLKQIPEYARFGVKHKMMDVLQSELQLHGQTSPPDPQLQSSSIPNTPVYKESSPSNRPSTSSYNAGGIQYTSNLQQLRVKIENDSPHSNSSTITSPLSDCELYDEQ